MNDRRVEFEVGPPTILPLVMVLLLIFGIAVLRTDGAPKDSSALARARGETTPK